MESLRLCSAAGPAPRSLRAAALAFALPLASAAAGAGAPGIVQMSDGYTIEGALSLTQGHDLRMHAGADLRDIPFDRVREIRMWPTNELMLRAWRFREAGRTEKEYTGEPYPVREMQAAVRLSDGTAATGHLYTTALYAEDRSGNVRKLVLSAKLRGKPGQTLDDLAYPASIEIVEPAPEGADPASDPAPAAAADIVFLAGPSLIRRTGLAAPPSDVPGARVFRATRDGGALRVKWPAPPEPALFAAVSNALADAQDFFDERTLLAVAADPAGNDLYSLLMLQRRGHTTLGAERSQPWQLVVWRWKRQPAPGRLMLCGRGYFFRGIIGRSETPPAVIVDLAAAASAEGGARP